MAMYALNEVKGMRLKMKNYSADWILASNTNQNIKKIEKDTERDYFMEAPVALEYGIIDEILKKR